MPAAAIFDRQYFPMEIFDLLNRRKFRLNKVKITIRNYRWPKFTAVVNCVYFMVALKY